MTKYEAREARGRRDYGDRWDASDLDAAGPGIREAYEHGERVKVERTYRDGSTEEITGRVSTTTGWRPAYLLIRRSSDHGSSDVLGPRDRVVAVKRGRVYV